MMKSSVTSCLVFVVGLSLTFSSVTYGAEEEFLAEEEEEFFALEEIVVTAQKREETQQDIPASFNVYSAENLKATGWTNITDMADLIPSMEVIGVTKSRTTVFVRSIGTNKFDIGTEGSIGVFVDGIYVPRFSSLMQNLIDLERVEVLRGPQGTLYGRNTIGGAISLYSKDPQPEFEGTLNVSAANEGSYHTALSLTGPLSNKLLGYVALTSRETGGFREDEVSGRSDDETVMASRAKLHYLFSDETTLALTLEYSDSEVDAFLGEIVAKPGQALFAIKPSLFGPPTDAVIAAEATDLYTSAVTDPGGTEVESFTSSFQVEWAGEDLVVDSRLGFRAEKVEEVADNDRLIFDIINQVTEQNSDTYSEEFKISSESGGAYSMDDKLEWITGVFLYLDDADRGDNLPLGSDVFFADFPNGAAPMSDECIAASDLGEELADECHLPGTVPFSPRGLPPWGLPPYPLDFFVDLKTTSWAVFGQAKYFFTDSWSLTTGLRFSRDTKKFTYRATGPQDRHPQAFPLDTFEFDDTLRFESTDPKVVLEWTPNTEEPFLAYFSYSEGYKSGGIQFIARREPVAKNSFDKELLKAFEMGMKSRWFEQRLQLNAAIYQYDYKDQQIQGIVDAQGATQVITDNAAASTLSGLEVDLQYLLAKDLLMQASYSYIDATFDDYLGPDGSDFTGNVLPAAPENSLWVSLEYNHTLSNGWKPGVRFDYSWRDDQVFTPDGANEQAAYALSQFAFILFDPTERMKFRLYCTNCNDKDYVTSVVPLTGETAWAATGDRRRYGLEYTYSL